MRSSLVFRFSKMVLHYGRQKLLSDLLADHRHDRRTRMHENRGAIVSLGRSAYCLIILDPRPLEALY